MSRHNRQTSQNTLLINCESYNARCYAFQLINYTVLLRLTDKTAAKYEYEVIQLSSTMSGSVQSTVYSVSSKHYWTHLDLLTLQPHTR